MSTRLKKELASLEENPDPRFFVENVKVNVEKHFDGKRKQIWTCMLLIEPITSAYRDAEIVVELGMDSEYPFHPPEVIFVNNFFHPFVNELRLCRHIFSNGWNPHCNIRGCLDKIYKMIVNEGRNIKCVCEQRVISDMRDNDYMMFDKIVQRCLDRPADWDTQMDIQTLLNQIQLNIVTDLFGGSGGIETIVQNFLGLNESKNYKTVFKIEAVTQSDEQIVLKTSDNQIHNIKKWSNLKLLDHVDISEEIPLPFDSNSLENVLNQCREQKGRTIRVYNEFTQVTETKVELLRLIKTADQLGAENIVILNCLKLSQVIRNESRAMIAT
tara:strand:+ start:4219 stop:5199 length:981 start_codon:yes stop_codon:yes gene_type:complete